MPFRVNIIQGLLWLTLLIFSYHFDSKISRNPSYSQAKQLKRWDWVSTNFIVATTYGHANILCYRVSKISNSVFLGYPGTLILTLKTTAFTNFTNKKQSIKFLQRQYPWWSQTEWCNSWIQWQNLKSSPRHRREGPLRMLVLMEERPNQRDTQGV